MKTENKKMINPIIEKVVNHPMIDFLKNDASKEDYDDFAQRVEKGIAFRKTPEGIKKTKDVIKYINNLYE